MKIATTMAKLFKMDERTWQKHSNPLSVWTRYLTLPGLILIVWSRIWIGLWFIPLLFIGLVWLFFNPRAFSKPKTTNSWPAKVTLGERVWLNQKEIPIPKTHAFMAKWLVVIGKLFLIYLLYGLIFLDLYATFFGYVLLITFKSWFCDRMVWLYEDMKHIPRYSSWLY